METPFIAINFETAETLIKSGVWIDVGKEAQTATSAIWGEGCMVRESEHWLMSRELRIAACSKKNDMAAAATLRIILKRLFRFERLGGGNDQKDSFDYVTKTIDGLQMRVVRERCRSTGDDVVLLSLAQDGKA